MDYLSDYVKKRLYSKAIQYTKEHFFTDQIYPVNNNPDFASSYVVDLKAKVVSFWFNVYSGGTFTTSLVYEDLAIQNEIQLSNSYDTNFSEVIVSGEPTVKDICRFINEHYKLVEMRSKVIWDFSNSSLKNLTERDLVDIGQTAKKNGRYNHITYVGDNLTNASILRMYTAIGGLRQKGNKYEVSNSLENAINWINRC